MRTSRLLVFIALLLFSALSYTSCHCHRTSEMTITKNMDDLPFEKINIGSFFKVTFTQGEDYQVQVKVSEHFSPYLISKIQDGELTVYIDRHELRIRHLKVKDTAEIQISAPDFKFMELQGATKMDMVGKWDLTDAAIRINGASKFGAENITAQHLSIKQLGASLLEANLAVDHLNIITTGACKMVMKSTEPYKGSELKLKVSGASKVNLQELPFNSIKLDATGTSHIKIHPRRHLNAQVTGTSVVRYDDSSRMLEKDIKKTASATVKAL